MDRVAAVDDEVLAGQERGVGGQQPVYDLAELLRPAEAALVQERAVEEDAMK